MGGWFANRDSLLSYFDACCVATNRIQRSVCRKVRASVTAVPPYLTLPRRRRRLPQSQCSEVSRRPDTHQCVRRRPSCDRRPESGSTEATKNAGSHPSNPFPAPSLPPFSFPPGWASSRGAQSTLHAPPRVPGAQQSPRTRRTIRPAPQRISKRSVKSGQPSRAAQPPPTPVALAHAP